MAYTRCGISGPTAAGSNRVRLKKVRVLPPAVVLRRDKGDVLSFLSFNSCLGIAPSIFE